jgi:hypothetical protein
MKKLISFVSLSILSLSAMAVNISFDGVANGVTTFSYDADSDSNPDAVFTKIGSGAWSFGGPTASQFVSTPGLTAGSASGDDLRVDFPNGAKTIVGFAFARSDPCSARAVGYSNSSEEAELRIYDSAGLLLGSSSVTPTCTLNTSGSFVEGEVTVSFVGTASYAVVDFKGSEAYILDNFNGTFGSVEIAAAAAAATPVAVPTLSEWAMILLASLMAVFTFRTLRRK